MNSADKISRDNHQLLHVLCGLCIVFSCILKLIYAQKVPFDISQHDLASYVLEKGETGVGHLGYIQYLSFFHQLPESITFQYYQPPVFYLISSAIYSFIATTPDRVTFAFEVLQTVNMLYACISIIIAWKIFVKLIDSPIIRFISIAEISFAPVFFNIGIVLNNDSLVTMLILLSTYLTILWMEEPTMKRIIQIALAFAAAILTKTSAILLSPAIGCAFLYILMKGRGDWKKLFGQFIVFAMICIPLGMSWVVRNYILFQKPFSYVPRMSDDNPQYIGDISLLYRLLIPSGEQFTSYAINWNTPEKYANIWAQTMLSFTIDEELPFAGGAFAHWMLISLNALGIPLHVKNLMAVFALVMTFIQCDYRKIFAKSLILGIAYIVFLISYVRFAFAYPFICTMNARYISQNLVFGIMCFGVIVESQKGKKCQTPLLYGWGILTGIMSISSASIFICGALG